MAGGGSQTNVFAALETLRRKKKSDKEQGTSKKGGKGQGKEPEPQVFWAPAPLTVKSWADVDDDEDDYYATTAPPRAAWDAAEPEGVHKESSTPLEESESEVDHLLDEGDDDVDDEHDPEPEPEPEPLIIEESLKKPVSAPIPPKDTERQLSKKELKKKELAELDAVLAELGISNKESNELVSTPGAAEEKPSEDAADMEKKENGPIESKSAKKKKAKKVKEASPQDQQANGGSDTNVVSEEAVSETAEEESSNVDVKERLKKVASMKKKKAPNKELDAAARAAAVEAAARKAKLAAAKKKEKHHYNQQPPR